MIALNLILMTTVAIGIVSLLSAAIVSDRRSQRTAGGELSPTTAPLHRNPVRPRELRNNRNHTLRTRPAQATTT